MSKNHFLGLFLVAGAIIVVGAINAPASDIYKTRADSRVLGGALAFELIRVTDADTYVGDVFPWFAQSNRVRVRLRGVDTPEPKSKCAAEKRLAAEGKKFVRAWFAANPQVELVQMQLGKYGRVVADIRAENGELLSDALLTAELGRVYHGGKRKNWC